MGGKNQNGRVASPESVLIQLRIMYTLFNTNIKFNSDQAVWVDDVRFYGPFNSISVTLMCLSIGTPKAINFPFVSNEKLMFFRCPNIQAHYNEAVIFLNFGTSKNNEFSIWNKWKIYYFSVSQYLSTLGYFVNDEMDKVIRIT